ncbi:MAG: CsiV family protein [Steroidobacteraceae bacterium]
MIVAALTALLACAVFSLVGTPASAQATAASPGAASRASQQPVAPSRASAPTVRTAPAARSARAYRIELVVFRVTKALGSPEDWAAEAGGAPTASTDVDPGVSTESTPPGDPVSSGAPASPSHPAPAQAQAAPTQPAPSPAHSAAPQGQPASPQGSLPIPSASHDPPSNILRLLPPADFQLDGVASRLRASGRYVPVAHLAWVQTASPWGRPLEIPLQSVGLDAQGITGTASLELGQFLHLALDLRYTMSDPPAGLSAPPGTVFVLDQSHRVRLRERNYFDHPAFGVIAVVTAGDAQRKPAP